MRKLLVVLFVLMLAVPAFAQQYLCYSWEDGGTILGYYGNVVDPTNVSGSQTGSNGTGTYTCPGPYQGDYYLHVAEEPHSSTPQAYIAWITNLQLGDVVTAGFYGYDDSPSASPSLRVWGHWTDSVDPTSYYGSASGLYDYTAGGGWDYVEYTWAMPDTVVDYDGLMVEARLYSSPSSGDYRTDYWIDYVCVTAPSNAVIIFPEPGISPVEDETWTNIKGMYR